MARSSESRLRILVVTSVLFGLVACERDRNAEQSSLSQGVACKGDSAEDCSRRCEEGSAKSCYILGRQLIAGEISPKDSKKAAEAYRKACALDFGEGCGALAEAYLYAVGVEQSQEQWVALNRKACTLGDSRACAKERLITGLTGTESQKKDQGSEATQATDTEALVRAALKIESDEAVKRIHALLQAEASVVQGFPLPEGVSKPDLGNFARRYSDDRDYVLLAVELLSAEVPQISKYEVAERLNAAINTTWPYYKKIFIPSEVSLVLPSDIPPMPEADPQFEWIKGLGDSYWSDPRYRALAELPAEQLPDGALAYLGFLAPVSVTSLHRGDEDGIPVENVLKRYGDRLYPALLYWLNDPVRYGLAKEPSPSGYFIRWATELSEVHQQQLMRAALHSGWGGAVDHLDGNWRKEICEEFMDSPYGVPSCPA